MAFKKYIKMGLGLSRNDTGTYVSHVCQYNFFIDYKYGKGKGVLFAKNSNYKNGYEIRDDELVELFKWFDNHPNMLTQKDKANAQLLKLYFNKQKNEENVK